MEEEDDDSESKDVSVSDENGELVGEEAEVVLERRLRRRSCSLEGVPRV